MNEAASFRPSRTIPPSFALWLVPILLLFAAVRPAAAQQAPRATATLSENRVAAGDPVEYRIEVNGARTASRPAEILVEGLTITPTGQSSSFSYQPGTGLVASVTYIYQIETTKPGTFVIPEQQFAAGGTSVRANAVQLTVTGSGQGGGAAEKETFYFAELIIPKKSAYIGEAIPIEIRCYFSPRVRFEPDMNPILKGEGFTVQKFTEPQQDTVEVQGQPFSVIIYKSSLVPLKAGPLSIGPVEFNCIVVVPRPRPRGRSNDPFSDPFFRDPFGSFAIQKRVEIKSELVALEVLPLPPGAPPSFSGAIGQFTIEAGVDPRQANVGDPLTMRLTINGRGNFDRINAPSPADANGWRVYPASGKFKPEDNVKMRGAKTFEQIIVPLDRRPATPRYEFSFLDPATGAYRTLAAEPIPLQLGGGTAPTPTPVPAAGSAPVAQTPVPSPTPAPLAVDILHIRTDGPGGGSFRALQRSPWFWTVQALALGLLLGLGARVWWRQRPSGLAARAALARRTREEDLLRTLRAAGTTRGAFHEAAARLAQVRAAARSGAAPETLDARDVIRFCDLSGSEGAGVETIFRQRDELAFSGSSSTEAMPSEGRREIIELLENLAREPVRK